MCDEEQTIPETLEKLTTQIEKFETNMLDFDEFVSALNIDPDSVSLEQRRTKFMDT